MARRSFTVRDIAEILEHWHRGRPLSAVAQSLGVDRQTVRKYARAAERGGFVPGQGTGPPEGWAAWVDQQFPGIRERWRQHPTGKELDTQKEAISALLREVRPTVAWRRLRREQGMTVSLSSFRRYVQHDLADLLHQDGAQITVRRPDPPPGDEAQVDYGFLGMWLDPWTQTRRAVHVFVMVLTHSRHLFAQAVFRMDQQAWITCHEAAFAFFHGVPERIVPDNLKAGVLTPDLYDPQLNRSYEELAQHYGFLIDPARSRKPKDKPRVEKMVQFVREDFWKGRSFSSLLEINAALVTWCRTDAGQRIHGTTHERPAELFRLVEQPALRPLPLTEFEMASWAQAKVSRDCHIQVSGAWYSIPHRHVGVALWVRSTQRLVQCYRDHELIKTHVRVAKGQRSTDWADYPPEKAAFFLRTPDWCRRQAAGVGPSVAAVIQTLLDDHALYHLRQAQGVLRLTDKYPAVRLDAACHRALAFGDPAYRTVKTILERGLEGKEEEEAVALPLLTAGAFLHGPEELLAAGRAKEGALA